MGFKANKKVKNYPSLFLIMVMVICVALWSGCKKPKKEDTTEVELNTAEELDRSEFVILDAINIADAAARKQIGIILFKDSILGACAAVSMDTGSVNHKIKINFGPVNCLGYDNRNRRGAIVINYAGDYFVKGNSKIISFENYYCNDKKVEGLIKIINNTGKKPLGVASWDIEVDNLKVYGTNGEPITWNCRQTREMILGELTPFWVDDIYRINGYANGLTSKGYNFSASLTTPVVITIACFNIVSGNMVVNISNKPTITLDYGTGACSNFISVLINGKTVTLKNK